MTMVFAGGASEETVSTDPNKPYAGQTIRIISANQPCVESSLQNYFDEFTEKTGIKVEIEILGTDQFTNKVTVELSAKTSTLDVIFLKPLTDLKLYYQNGWLTDLTPYFENDAEFDLSDYYESSLNSCSYNGSLFGIPFVAESQIMYYRTDVFEANNLKVPENFDELYETALALTDKDNDFYGYVGRGKTNQCVTQFSTFLRNFGGDFNTPTESLVNTPAALKAYNYYGKLLGNCAPPGVTNMSFAEAAAIFAQGKAAMFIDSDAIYSNVTDNGNSDYADVTSFALVPAGPEGQHPFFAVAAAWGIPAFSQHKEAAIEFLKWACSKAMDVIMTKETQNPGCRASTWNNPEATSGYPAKLLEVMLASREISVAGDRPTVINVTEARDIISVPIVQAIMGQDPTAAAAEAHAKFQALIDKENAAK